MVTESDAPLNPGVDSLTERDLKALRIFRVAAQAGGFAAAESRLEMSRATISRRINEVEMRLGARLCVRGPQGFELTGAGMMVLQLTSEALDALDRIKPHVDALRGVISGDLRVGITDSALSDPACRVPQALGMLSENAPVVRLDVQTLTSNELMRALVERRIHVAIKGVFEREPSLSYVDLFDETHGVYTLDDGAASRKCLPLVNRIAQPFVADAIARHGYARGPNAAGLDSVALLVATGRFCGILPHHYAALLTSRIPLRVLPDSPTYSVRFCALTDGARVLPPSGAWLLERLRELHAG